MGDTGIFAQGLYGSSEMFVDAFMQLYKNKILKRQVFDSVPLMKLINQGYLGADNIPADIIDKLLDMKAIRSPLSEEDFNFLTHYGILRSGLVYENGYISDGETHYAVDLDDNHNRIVFKRIVWQQTAQWPYYPGAFFVGPKINFI